MSVTSPSPGQVLVTLLSIHDNGQPSPELVQIVSDQLNQEDIRPLTDQVTVQGAEIIGYQIDATLTFSPGPGRNLVIEQAKNQVMAYATQQHKLGQNIALSGLYAALHQPGVQKVVINTPGADIPIQPHQAGFAQHIHITPEHSDD